MEGCMRVNTPAIWLLISLTLMASIIVAMPGASYSRQDRAAPLAEATRHHPAGTDALGRDRLVRVAAALLLSLGGALAASAVTTAAAAGVGTLAAFGPAGLG